MRASSSGSMSASGRASGAFAGSATASHGSAAAGKSPSWRATTRGTSPRAGPSLSNRSPSRISATGSESFRANSISGRVHHEFMPTAAAPTEMIAQWDSTHSG